MDSPYDVALTVMKGKQQKSEFSNLDTMPEWLPFEV